MGFLMSSVLIVDDSKFMRNIIRESLESGNHQVIAEADNGIDAIQLFKEKGPDIVTMDITIHGKDGIQAMEEIFSINPSAKVIVVSALSEKTLKNSGRSINATAYLSKPFTKENLLQTIDNVVSNK